jgi:hypothetical protein
LFNSCFLVLNITLLTTWERRGAHRTLAGNLSEGDHLKDPGVDRRIILKWIFESLDGVA